MNQKATLKIKKVLWRIVFYRSYILKNKLRGKQIFDYIRKVKLVNMERSKALNKILKVTSISLNSENRFIYFIDKNAIGVGLNILINNFTIDYSQIINGSLLDLKVRNGNEMDKAADALIFFAKRVEKLLSSKNDPRALWFKNVVDKKACSLEEALQRILFLNQVLWQTGHKLNGLGRLDYILKDLYCSKDNNCEIIRDFYLLLHKDYYFKSNVLSGDTGQIIVLGGLRPDDTYFYNDLTFIFMEVAAELKIPDPKLLIRVSVHMPRMIVEKALECLKSATGSPLFSNDDLVIPCLIEYGFDRNDAHNYAVSACWEPYIPGKALDQNNSASLNFITPLERTIDNININNFESLLIEYEKNLIIYVEDIAKRLDNIKFCKDPLISLFYENCRKSGKDISEGGAKYNNFGITSVGIGNLVNSLLNIDKLVFKDKRYTLQMIRSALSENFVGHDEILTVLKNSYAPHFGHEDSEELTNRITKTVSTYFASRKNKFGGGIKFGLSSPSYISAGEMSASSPDGRKSGEPLATHISATGLPYTQLVNFSSKLQYFNGRFNGNVVDFFLSPGFLEQNFDKFVDFMEISIKLGFFQMQMNITDSKTLIAAKNNPQFFEKLIVRVWGFSAYFVDLPEAYQNLLIERALAEETA